MSALDGFSPATRDWFRGAFAAPTAAQEGAWAAAQAGRHALVVAPTGSGKTLAAFLWALDRLASDSPPPDPRHRCRVLYVSPLKALAVDVQRNLRAPLTGIRQAAQRAGTPPPEITVGMRTGDTPADERRLFARTPPDVLVTTPESLFLLLTSAARESLRGVRTVILDEVHAVAGTKRGAHLALSLERLDALLGSADAAPAPGPAQRIGLSATVRPLDEVATFLAGARPVEIVQPPAAKTIEVAVEVPVPDLAALDERPAPGSSDEEVVGSAAGTAQRPSIWPAVERRLLDLVRQHRSTIVFANSRRLAERLTARLNELAAEEADEAVELDAFPAEAVGQSGIGGGAPPVVAKAHHGSMSREQRTVVEEELKGGLLPCVVATSSLELGIDMGAVDLVVQVEAPPSVASGLQRVGRAGHQVGAVSRGVVFPKYRGDLVSCTVVAERMTAGAIESLRYPRNPLDVLAQHVVAMVALDPWTVGDLAAVVRRAAPFAALPDSALHAVLDMLAGRYPSEEFGELRARITWDRVTDELRGRPGAQRLAVTSGGTIPDRGLFTVTTPGGADGRGSRVGELDEEMVYESRVGDTFLLGTSSWRVEDITHDRVIVTPAPGVPARMPFWKGESIGRPLELGRARGRVRRGRCRRWPTTTRAPAPRPPGSTSGPWTTCWPTCASSARPPGTCRATGRSSSSGSGTSWATGGSWCTRPFGAQVNGPWALAIAARMRERRGVEVHAVRRGRRHRAAAARRRRRHGRRGRAHGRGRAPRPGGGRADRRRGARGVVAVRVPVPRVRGARAAAPPPRPEAAVAAVAAAPAGGAAAGRGREVRAVPGDARGDARVRAGRVRPARAARADGRRRSAGRCGWPRSRRQSPSPFARSLLFGYVGMFLYEADAPLAERRAAALSLDSTLLAELLGSEAIRELLDPEVVVEVERSLQRLAPDRHARDAEGAADLLRFLGPLSTAEAGARGVAPEWLTELETGAAGDPGPHRRRGAVERDRGRRSGPRRARRTAARRRARGVHRTGAGPGGRPAAAPRPHARPVPGGRGGGPVRSGRRRGLRGAGPPGRDRSVGPR